MRQLTALLRKEWMELIRTGKLVLLITIFILFGIMNPAIAKLTPWLMSLFAETLAESGMAITEVEVTALTSWTQFYKNIPMALILFLLIFSGTLTNEYQKGTLVNLLTKGMSRWNVIAAKTVTVIALWSVCYWLCYGITYCYTVYFWDNSIVLHPHFAALCMYLAGVWLISLLLLCSALFSSGSAVLAGTAILFAVFYLAGLLPPIKEYLPAQLLTSQSLLFGAETLSDYQKALWITGLLSFGSILGAVWCFNRKAL